MKRTTGLFIVLLSGMAGLALGFALRPRSTTQANVQAGSLPTFPTAFASDREPMGASKNDASPLATKLELDLSMSTGVTRWLYWLEAVERASLSDLPRLARLARDNSTAMRLVASRWIDLNPRHLFDTLLAADPSFPSSTLEITLLHEWPKRDPNAIIAALNEAPAFGNRNQWRARVAGSVIEQDAELGLRLFSEWSVENYGPRMTAIAKWAAADPRHAAEFTLGNPAGYFSRVAIQTVGQEWGKIDPAGALEFSASKLDALGQELAGVALKTWAERNLDEAADWLANADPTTRNRLSAPFVEVWARIDPASALSWSESNLSGTPLAQAAGGALKGAAERDVTAAARLVSAMSPSSARTAGAIAVAEKWLPENQAEDKPVAREIVAWIAKLDDESVRRVLEKVHWGWSKYDPKGLAEFLAASKVEHVPPHVYTGLAQTLARGNPMEAIEWSNQLPPGPNLSAGGEAFAEWRRAQPDVAMSWLHELPTADPRRQSFFQNAVRNLARDHQAAEQFAAMNSRDRAAARPIIEKMGLSPDRRDKLLRVLRDGTP
jgi:hypothetical protein